MVTANRYMRMLFNMIGRAVTAFLLIIVITVAGVGGIPAVGDDSPVETSETKLTPDEELEARSVAEQFARRIEDSDDLVSIVDDLYVKDFAERLGRDPADRFLVPVDWELASQVKGNELSRYHIAALRFNYLFEMLGGVWLYTHLPNKNLKPEDIEKELTPEAIFPPRVIALFKDDPAFAELLFEESKQNEDVENPSETNDGSAEQAVNDNSKKKAEDNDLTIKSIERLRSLVATLEQAVTIMREHLRSLPVPQTLQHMMDSVRRPDEETDLDLEPKNLRATTLAGKHLGAPKGTRLICVHVLIYHLDMIRVDGQLKILNVYVDDD